MKLSNVNVHIDKYALLDELTLNKRNQRVTGRIVREEIEGRIKKSREKLKEDFREHPVTKDIKRGPTARKQISGTLPGGYGNLFSFIGFAQGSDPIGRIRALISSPIKTQARVIGRGKFKIETNFPTKEKIFFLSPIPWDTARSWLDGIERGLSGFGYYLIGKNFGKRSRSGRAVQLRDKKLRSGKFLPTKYFSRMYKNFMRRIYRK